MQRQLQFVLAALLLALLSWPARAADKVQVRGAEHEEGFARIAVEWSAPITFDAKLEGDTLIIHFARAFTAQLTPLVRTLDHYVASVGQSADGTSIIAKLKKPVEIKTATVNGTIASINLLARSAAPPDKPAPKTPDPKTAVTQDEPKRPEPVKTEPERPEPKAVEAPTPSAPSAVLGAPVNLILPAAFTTDASAPAPTKPTAFRAVVAEKSSQAETMAPRTVDAVQVRGAEHESFGRIAVEWPSPITFDAKVDGDTLTIHFARAFTAQLAPLIRQLDHYVASVGQSADGTSIIAKLKKPVEIKTTMVNGTIASVDLVARVAGLAEKAAAKTPSPKTLEPKTQDKKTAVSKTDPKKPETARTEAAKTETAKAPSVVPPSLTPLANLPPPPSLDAAAVAKLIAPAASPDAVGGPSINEPVAKLTPLLTVDNDRVSLRFDWPTPTGAAIYRRGTAMWIVFAAPTALDLSASRARGQPILQAIDQVRADGATALRLVAADGINPSVRRAGNAWIIDLKRQEAVAEAPIVVDPRPEGPTPTVELRVRDASPPVRLRDPVLGDRLTIVPVGDIGRGIDATRDFVDFRLLPSVQGVVIRPNADDLEVKSDGNSVRITRRQGLVLSDERDRLLGRAIASRHRIFDFATWRGPSKQTFAERRSALERVIASSVAGARTRPRLELARFYFANLFGAETLSVLAQIARDDPQAASDANLHAMKGAACLLADNDDCATQELGQRNLDDEPEAGLWRGSLAAGKGDWLTAAHEFLRGAGLLSSYPKPLRNRFALQAAETMLENDRAMAAGPLLDMVLKDTPEPGELAMALYLQGRIEQQLGHLEPALEHWVKVAAMNDRKARARALYARAMALYEAKKVSRTDTIKTLDGLRFAWRGDNFEFTLLRRLGELKLAEKDPEGGLETLNLAVTYFPDYPAAKDVAKEAVDTFVDLFIGKAADDMPPVKALALYDAFQTLDPAGERHDAIVKKLVDRLVSVDLLDRAGTLLGDQVKSHLNGVDKARAATQLALLRLMNHQPEVAIAALDIDVNSGLTPELTRQRQELRARALFDLNRAPEALAMLANDNSRDAYRLRADIYWRQHDWKNASRVFTSLVGQPPAQGTLDPESASLVLNWAAALTLDGDQQGLTKLRHDFGPAIAGTPSEDAFNVVAGDSSDSGNGTPTEIASRVAQVGMLQNFMSAYKQRLANTKLSAIN